MERHARCFFQKTKKTGTDIVQFRHLAERLNVIIISIKGHETGVAAIADMHGGNRRGFLDDM